MFTTLRRPLALTAVMALALVTLSGCFKIAMNLDLKTNDTVDGSIVMAIDKQYSGLLGDQAFSGSGLDAAQLEQLGATATTKPYDDGTYVGQEIDFTGAPLSSFGQTMAGDSSAAGDHWSLTHSGGQFVFDASMDMSSSLGDLGSLGGDLGGTGLGGTGLGGTGLGDLGSGLAQSLLGNASFTVAITFPGKVVSTNGTVNGTTVTWKLDLTGPNTLSATAEDHGGGVSSISSGVWIALVAGLIVLAVIAYLFFRRKGGAEPAPTASEPTVPEAAPESPSEEASPTEEPPTAPPPPAG